MWQTTKKANTARVYNLLLRCLLFLWFLYVIGLFHEHNLAVGYVCGHGFLYLMCGDTLWMCTGEVAYGVDVVL